MKDMQQLLKEAPWIATEYPQFAKAYENPAMSEIDRKQLVMPVLQQMRERVRKDHVSINILHRKEEALTDFVDWAGKDNFALQKNDCSRAHKLAAAFKSDRVLYAKSEVHASDGMILLGNAQIFVVRNNWADAFKNATDFDGEFKLPFNHNVFEFRMGGKTIIVVAMQTDEGVLAAQSFIQCKEYWISLEEYAKDYGPTQFAWEQIRAISIALEAEVAVKDVVRAPANLNKKRTEKGELPLFDYHVVSLARRHRVAPAGLGTHRSPRLHFRRGHWRHFDSHKTWIKWMLVGDPELGFIDKDYRL